MIIGNNSCMKQTVSPNYIIRETINDNIQLAKILIEGCKKHPSYRCKRRPTSDCETCKTLYESYIKFNKWCQFYLFTI